MRKLLQVMTGCVVFIGLMFLFVNACERENQFNNERLCKYHTKEVNAWAIRRGEEPPCQ